MGSRQALMLTTAVIESGAGLALLLAPGTVNHLLLGVIEPRAIALMIARVIGLGLIALGTSAGLQWNNQNKTGHGLIRGLLIYNLVAIIALAIAGTAGRSIGVLLRPVIALHGVMAAWSFALIGPKAGNEDLI